MGNTLTIALIASAICSVALPFLADVPLGEVVVVGLLTLVLPPSRCVSQMEVVLAQAWFVIIMIGLQVVMPSVLPNVAQLVLVRGDNMQDARRGQVNVT